ncbi:MAG: dinitrogenase iron-molybdenum cofactor biosynthesis protein [Ruminococcus sp.]|nr:dinitrogenase iron-molybdenum cofactor biosynthesis protein [Ruminococcus sp.]MBQ3916367.1 dinitrogenase iron-molybdenum cofactor biosynthesis protein [Ruminococcus sp.]
MVYRLAVASTDGIVVNQHFGHAQQFHIIEIDPENLAYSYAGTRETERVCQGHFHNESSFDKVIDVLSDVHAVIVAKIGQGASQQLESRGLTVYEAPFPIEPLMEKVISDKLWEVDKWQFPTKN